MSLLSTNKPATPTASMGSKERDHSPKCYFTLQSLPLMIFDFTPSKVNELSIFLILSMFSILLTVFSISTLFGRHVLAQLITRTFSPIGAVALGAIVIPVAVYLSFERIRHISLITSFMAGAQGVLTGAGLSHLNLPGGEPFVALPLIVTIYTGVVISQAIHTKKNGFNRLQHLLFFSITILLIHVFIGSLLGSLSRSYLFLTYLYTAFCIVPIQLEAFGNEQLIFDDGVLVLLFSGVVLSKCVAYAIFGEIMDKKQ